MRETSAWEAVMLELWVSLAKKMAGAGLARLLLELLFLVLLRGRAVAAPFDALNAASVGGTPALLLALIGRGRLGYRRGLRGGRGDGVLCLLWDQKRGLAGAALSSLARRLSPIRIAPVRTRMYAVLVQGEVRTEELRWDAKAKKLTKLSQGSVFNSINLPPADFVPHNYCRSFNVSAFACAHFSSRLIVKPLP